MILWYFAVWCYRRISILCYNIHWNTNEIQETTKFKISKYSSAIFLGETLKESRIQNSPFSNFLFLMCQVEAFRSSFRWYFYFQVLTLYFYLNSAFLVSSLDIIYSWDVKFLKFLSVIDVAIFDCCEHMFKIPCSNFWMLLTTLVMWAASRDNNVHVHN